MPSGLKQKPFSRSSPPAAARFPMSWPRCCRRALRVGRVLAAFGAAGAFGAASLTARAEDKPLSWLQTGGHTGRVTSVMFLPDPGHPGGKRLASTSWDRSVRLWSLTPSAPGAAPGSVSMENACYRYRSDDNRQGRIWSAAADPGGGRLALGMEARSPRENAEILIIAPDGKVERTLHECQDAVASLAYSRDGKYLAAREQQSNTTTKLQCRLFVYDMAHADKPPRVLALPNPMRPHPFAFSPDGQQLAYGDGDTIYMINTADGKPVKTRLQMPGITDPNIPEQERNKIECLAWASGGRIAAADTGGSVALWQEASAARKPETIFQNLKRTVFALDFDAKGDRLAVALDGGPGGELGQVAVWAANADAVRITARGPVTSVAFAPDGDLACGQADGAILLWKSQGDALDKTPCATLGGDGRPVYDVGWQGDGVLTWASVKDGALAAAFDLNDMNVVSADAHKAVTRSRALLPAAGGALNVPRGNDRPLVLTAEEGRFKYGAHDPQAGKVYAAQLAEKYIIREYDVSGAQAKAGRRFSGCEGEILSMSVSPDHRYLAAGTTEQCIYLWSLTETAGGADKPEIAPLITLFVGYDRQWIAWNPETGIYESSSRGDDILSFHLNDPANASPAKLVPCLTCRNLYRVRECMKELFRKASPDAAHRQIETFDTRLTLRDRIARIPEIADIKIPNGLNIVSNVWTVSQDTITPEVLFANQAASDGDTPTYTITNSQGGGVTTASSGKAITLEGSVAQGGAIKLFHGENILRIESRNKNGIGIPRCIVVNNPGGQDKTGVLRVIAVGVNKYPHYPEKKQLHYAVNDAVQIKEFFEKQNGDLYSGVDCHVLQDEQATSIGIMNAVRDLQAGPEDTVIFFVSGHGDTVDQKGNGGLQCVFCPYNYDESDKAGTSVAWQDIIRTLGEKHARHTLLFVDHCFAGGLNSATQADRQEGVDNVRRTLEQGSFITFVASQADQEAQEREDYQHGAFTYWLLSVLRGEGSARQRMKAGYVTVGTIWDTLKEEIKNNVPGQEPDLVNAFGSTSSLEKIRIAKPK